jgi:hypothetical protein
VIRNREPPDLPDTSNLPAIALPCHPDQADPIGQCTPGYRSVTEGQAYMTPQPAGTDLYFVKAADQFPSAVIW